MSDLSFAALTEELKGELLNKNRDIKDELETMLDSFLELSYEGVEVAVSIKHDCLLVRIFADGEYTFVSPIPRSESASIASALKLVRDYAVLEMLPLIFTDVPRSDLDYYKDFFKITDARIYPDDEDTFFVRVLTECDGVERLPRICTERLVLNEIKEKDICSYAKLCKDELVNKFWGYDAAADNPEGDDRFYIEVARREFELSQAITLGVFLDGTLIGEGVIYAFDYTGSASVGVRLLPEYQGRGFGSEAILGLISYCREIGLDYLVSDVMQENLASNKMMQRIFGEGAEGNGKIRYTMKLK